VLGTAAYVLAFYAFARSLQSIPTSTADAIYFAASTAIIAVVGVTVLRHGSPPARLPGWCWS
jgi:multidrug transporter EmrE-like cation transporter